MKKNVMKKWVAALRSGKYKQGKNHLNKNEQYCCLGVLCEVLGESKSKGGFGYIFYGSGPESSPKLLPLSALKSSGLRTDNGTINFTKGRLSLTLLNDIRGRSFKQIAAYIERNWEKL
jgi:hypothetical protein